MPPSRAEARPRPAPAGQSMPKVEWEALFQEILRHVETGPRSKGARTESSAGAEVLFQFRHDGMQYVFSRTQAGGLPGCNLSPREKEIVRLVARGLANKAIAAVLDVSPWTVSTHLRRIFTKMEVSSRAEMVARAMKDGLLA